MNKRLGIIAETRFREVLEARGCLTTRNAASHGPYDVEGVLGGSTGVFEVKATSKLKWSALRNPKVRNGIHRLVEYAREGGMMPVVAIWWDALKEWRLYTPERILAGIVRPEDADLELESVPSPKIPSPSVGFPPPAKKGVVTPEMREAVDTV
jgi:Holliday junction resolvase